MTSRQKEYYETICKLCCQLNRPVTAEEIAEAEHVCYVAANYMLNVLSKHLTRKRLPNGKYGYFPKKGAVICDVRQLGL